MMQPEEDLTKVVMKRYESGEYLLPSVKGVIFIKEGFENPDIPQEVKDFYSMLIEKQLSIKDSFVDHLSKGVKEIIEIILELGIVFENPRDLLLAVIREFAEREIESFDNFMKEKKGELKRQLNRDEHHTLSEQLNKEQKNEES